MCSGETLVGVVGLYSNRPFTDLDRHHTEQAVRRIISLAQIPRSAVS
jgi:hypothetical protein